MQLQKLSHWLIHDDIEMISNEYQVDAPETETERETETEEETEMSAVPPDVPPPSSDLPVPEKEEFKIASFIADKILERDPGYRFLVNGKREKTITQWSEDIGKINRLDKREWEQIWNVTRWCLADSFWSKNILSGAKLRKQFDKLVAQQPTEQDSISAVGNGLNTPDGFEKVLQ